MISWLDILYVCIYIFDSVKAKADNFYTQYCSICGLWIVLYHTFMYTSVLWFNWSGMHDTLFLRKVL